MINLLEDCTLHVLTGDIIRACLPFSCGGDDDMDEFFRVDALQYSKYRIGNSYCFRLISNPEQIVCCFTLSSDSIRIYDLPSSRKQTMWKITKREKMLSRYPGVLIGRFAVDAKFNRHGIGSQLLKFIHEWMLEDNEKMASRFLFVDTKNKPEVIDFYQKNGFKTLFTTELQEDLYTEPPLTEGEKTARTKTPRILKTRLMYKDMLS